MKPGHNVPLKSAPPAKKAPRPELSPEEQQKEIERLEIEKQKRKEEKEKLAAKRHWETVVAPAERKRIKHFKKAIKQQSRDYHAKMEKDESITVHDASSSSGKRPASPVEGNGSSKRARKVVAEPDAIEVSD